MSDGRPPQSPPPPPPVTPIISGGRPWWQQWWMVVIVSVALIVGLAAAITATTGDDNDDVADPEPPDTQPTDTEPPTSEATGTEPTGTTPASTEPTSAEPADEPPEAAPPPDTPAVGEVDGAPAGVRGERTAPVPAGQIADIGDGWRLQVLGVVDDGTALVLEENQFNDPPPDGSRFTLVEIALGYFGVDDPGSAFLPTIQGFTSSGVELDDRCGVIPDRFEEFIDLFAGGVTRGTICLITTPAEAETMLLYGSSGFDGPDVFIEVAANEADTLPSLRGPQPGAEATPPRIDPIAIGIPVELPAGWTLTVLGPATDITDDVAAENQFNDPPPDGFRFVGVDLELAYDGGGVGSGFDVTVNAVADGNVQLGESCGVIPTPVDLFADVPSGTSVTGTACFVTPVDDVGSLLVYAVVDFGSTPTVLATS